MRPRKVELKVMYNSVDASRDIGSYLMGFTYTDAENAEDTISLQLQDRDKNWSNGWIPQKGDRICPEITQTDWNQEGDTRSFVCGDFLVDDYTLSGPETQISINAVSSPADSGFKETQRTQTWEKVTLQKIAQEISGRYGLALNYDADEYLLDRIEQSGKTDSSFLKGLCNKYGLGLKVYSGKMILWDYERYAEKPAKAKITPDIVTGQWNYRSTMQGTYTGAKVSYLDAKTQEDIEILVGTEGRVYRINERANSVADAERMGRAAIYSANRTEFQFSASIIPSIPIVTTDNVEISGFGAIDGKYCVMQAVHTLGNGYSVQLTMGKVIEMESTGGQNDAGTGETLYVVKRGDTLWDLAKQFYGNSRLYTVIYDRNRDSIEAAAKEHGKTDSKGGHWIWPGQTLAIPQI